MRQRQSEGAEALPANAHWYKEAIIYEIHVRAFADSNGDGIGDFGGLVEKLDYLQDLGITAVWLLPFYPSPLRDGGYDISDYTSINPAYGTLRDFVRFLRAAHARGIRVITELVLNHTSSEHEWFRRARHAPPGSKWRDFYVWSDTPARYHDARIIFKDFETSNWSWDPVAKAYYWHRFYAHQPDLNFANPEVHKAVLKAVDFWLDLGVDGLRLDAVPYLYEREGTNCENLPETHELLKRLRAHVDERYRDRMLLAEANQWPEDAAAYFGAGDECHMNFHFPLMPRMFMSVQLEDRFPIVDILRQTPAIPPSCQWAIFLRNHDELTLEMVTDEDRDYMYRVYAEDPSARINLGIRRRLAPLVRGRRKMELMNGLLMSLPGTPVLYYGDEVGMGDNIYLGDRDGVRTPMQWSADRNAGFSTASPQKLYLPIVNDAEYHYEAVNVQAQQANPSSLLWWMKRLIALRKEYPVFGGGDIQFLYPDNGKILAFVRSDERQRVLVVANLSRFSQGVELDLAAYQRMVPVEMFGRTPFPVIGERPYFLSIGPHGFYWFSLESADGAGADRASEAPRLEAAGSWRALFSGRSRAQLALTLADFAAGRRWFRGKARVRKNARIGDVVPLDDGSGRSLIALLELDYVEGDPEVYAVPLGLVRGEEAHKLEQRSPSAVIARVRLGEGERGRGKREARPSNGQTNGQTNAGSVAAPLAADEWLLVDGLQVDGAARLMDALRRRATLAGESGALHALAFRAFKEVAGAEPPPPRPQELEQTNSTVFFGDRMVLKLYRQVEQGANPEVELGAFLTAHARSRTTPRMLGAIEYRHPRQKEPATVVTVQELIANEGVAWQSALGSLDRFFERVLTEQSALTPPSVPDGLPSGTLIAQSRQEPAAQVLALLGTFGARMRKLGRRTGELHLALASEPADARFAPEPFTGFYQQSLYQGAHRLLARTLELLRKAMPRLPPAVTELGEAVLADEARIDARLRSITARKIEVMRIRVHGDLHLGQVLDTGDDFVIIDFEGEPARPVNERRYKRNPLRDVAGMMRSFHYASEAALRSGRVRPEDQAALAGWAHAWAAWVRGAYLGEYLATVGPAPFIPASEGEADFLLAWYQLEKCIYEVRYELNNRPDWLVIPLAGLRELMAQSSDLGA